MKRSSVIGTALLIGTLSLTGCTEGNDDNDVCDTYEATDYGDDCGYWVDDGSGNAAWVWYTWVTPYSGGTPPKGTKPTVPAGTKTVPPPKTKPALPPGVVKPPPPKAPPAGPKPPAPKPPAPKGK